MRLFVQSSRLLNDIFYRPCLARAEKYMAKFIKPEAKSRNQKPETRKEISVEKTLKEIDNEIKRTLKNFWDEHKFELKNAYQISCKKNLYMEIDDLIFDPAQDIAWYVGYVRAMDLAKQIVRLANGKEVVTK